MLASRRWRDWNPSGIIQKSPEHQLTKPTKPFPKPILSVLSVPILPDSKINDASASIPPIDPAEWREPFKAWLNSHCFRTPRWFTAVYALHDDYCDWEIVQNGVPCTREMFLGLLAHCGFLVGDNGAALVSGLAMRKDIEAFNLTMQAAALQPKGAGSKAA